MRLVRDCKKSDSDFIFIGDSVVRHFHKYSHVLKRHFKNALKLGMSGDCTQHVLWRLKLGLLPLNGKYFVIHVGTNNIASNNPMEIAEAIVQIAVLLKQKNAQIIGTGLLLRCMYPSATRNYILCVNHHLKMLLHKCRTVVLYIPPDDNWLCPDGRLNMKFF